MSRQAINKLLARAMIDSQFADKLLAKPLQTLQESGFELTLEEQQVFREAYVRDMCELSQLLLAQLAYEEL
ncbi:MAG: Os1348 family NHLP clan protein [Ktedonobacteraceae bacterium]